LCEECLEKLPSKICPYCRGPLKMWSPINYFPTYNTRRRNGLPIPVVHSFYNTIYRSFGPITLYKACIDPHCIPGILVFC
jgi:hypothetical protein